MKALKNSPEWNPLNLDKLGKPTKKKKDDTPIKPYDNYNDLHVRVRGYDKLGKRHEGFAGKGNETFFINIKNEYVDNDDVAQYRAKLTRALLLTGKPEIKE